MTRFARIHTPAQQEAFKAWKRQKGTRENLLDLQLPLPVDTRRPVTWAYGLGVDSTDAINEEIRRGERPDLILFADVRSEKPETYAYLPVQQAHLAKHKFPPVIVVAYQPTDFKHWPPYYSLEENLLTNSTLPSLAFGFKSCSQKWKIGPQDKYCQAWQPAMDWWSLGGKVLKKIGYDAGPQDIRRRNHLGTDGDPLYEFSYPLQEWGWAREQCKEEIRRGGQPVPPKSACYFCPASQPEEIDLLAPFLLRRIVAIETRAQPRLEGVEGLWRTSTKKRPGRMTDYIRAKGLLPADEVDRLMAVTPTEALTKQDITSWQQWLADLTNEGEVQMLKVL
jgi:hypothetical protein